MTQKTPQGISEVTNDNADIHKWLISLNWTFHQLINHRIAAF